MDWIKEFPAAITVCDKNGTITNMNEKAAVTFKDDGGYDLIGKSLFACHSNASNEIINRIMNAKRPNAYTIEKKGVKKFIYQAPWYENNELRGLVELSFEIPFDMPHFLR